MPTIIPDSHAKLPFVVMDLHFDPLRLRVPEGIAHRLGNDPVDFVAKYRTQIARRTLHRNMKGGGVRFAVIPFSRNRDQARPRRCGPEGL